MILFRISIILMPLLLAGCMGNVAKSSLDRGQVNVFGVALYDPTDYREIKGVRGVDEPCLRGYERSFDSLDIVIGYGKDGKVRKITSRNPQNSLFGIHPGDTVVSALDKISAAGFIQNGTPYRFKKEGLLLTLLVDEVGKLFGMTLEIADK